MILAVKVGQLAELVWVAAAAGLIVSLTFSLALLGAARGGDARRSGQGGAPAWFLLSALATAAFAATVVLAVIMITTKS
jgi:hypothetical protein